VAHGATNLQEPETKEEARHGQFRPTEEGLWPEHGEDEPVQIDKMSQQDRKSRDAQRGGMLFPHGPDQQKEWNEKVK
jgi:hypothetical protein